MDNVSKRVKNSADWFCWIAILSIINNIIILAHGNINFIVGLGITQVIDYLSYALSKSLGPGLMVISFTINILISLFFMFIGYKARKGAKWAFILGMVLYVLDGLLFLLAEDYISIGFHAFALYCIFIGYRALVKSNKKPESQGENIYEQQNI